MRLVKKWWFRLLCSLVLAAFIIEMLRIRTDLINGSAATMLLLACTLIIYFCLSFTLTVYKKVNPRKLDLKKKRKDEDH